LIALRRCGAMSIRKFLKSSEKYSKRYDLESRGILAEVMEAIDRLRALALLEIEEYVLSRL
jgi:hypothetical protein